MQLTCGGLQTVYHGGLLHTRLRYYDAVTRRPGLPEDVSALGSHLGDDSVTVSLLSGSPMHERRVILQAEAFNEHRFTSMSELGSSDSIHTVDDRYVEVTLPPGRSIDLRCGMDRYVHRPSYGQPI